VTSLRTTARSPRPPRTSPSGRPGHDSLPETHLVILRALRFASPGQYVWVVRNGASGQAGLFRHADDWRRPHRLRTVGISTLASLQSAGLIVMTGGGRHPDFAAEYPRAHPRDLTCWLLSLPAGKGAPG
jgi:hypothetical protein